MVLKHTINIVFLLISIFLSTYFMIQLSNNPFIQAGIAVFAIGLEAAMQYVLALGKAYFKKLGWAKLQALILFICYACYILVYNIPSAVGFFVMEIDVQEQVAAKVWMAETISRQRLEQIGTTINNLNLQLTKEAETGYGNRSRAIMEQLERLSKEQKRLQGTFSGHRDTEVSKNVFSSLEGVIGVPGNVLKIVIFGTSILMLCVILIITSWDIKLPSINQDIPVTVTPRNDVTRNIVTVTDNDNACPVCGGPAKPGGVYCSDKCRVAAYRERKRLKEAEAGGY